MDNVERLQAWIACVFDHPVTDREWYWINGVEQWPEAPGDIVAHIAATFERGSELLSRFSDEQLNQGFWYLMSGAAPNFMLTLLNEEIPLALRLRALKSFVPLFEQIMAMRCSFHLSHLNEPGANILNSACYMWFDGVLERFFPQQLDRSQPGAELVLVLRRILAISHDACRESALHGIGHWIRHYPELIDTIDEFLSETPGLRPELIAYAERARTGNVL